MGVGAEAKIELRHRFHQLGKSLHLLFHAVQLFLVGGTIEQGDGDTDNQKCHEGQGGYNRTEGRIVIGLSHVWVFKLPAV